MKNNKIVAALVVVVVLIAMAMMFTKPKELNTQPEIIRSYKVGDEPHYHRVWSVTVDGEEIKYVEIVNDWR